MSREPTSQLPQYVVVETTRHGKRVYYFRVGTGKRTRLPSDPNSQEFKRAYKAALTEPTSKDYPEPDRIFNRRAKRPILIDKNKLAIETRLKAALDKAKARAKEKQFGFDLDWEWARQQIEDSDYCCCMTGIPFFSAPESKSAMNPYVPSIDRIDSTRGYTRDNCRIVVYAFNAMLMDWGIPVFERVINNYIKEKAARNRLHKKTLEFVA